MSAPIKQQTSRKLKISSRVYENDLLGTIQASKEYTSLGSISEEGTIREYF